MSVALVCPIVISVKVEKNIGSIDLKWTKHDDANGHDVICFVFYDMSVDRLRMLLCHSNRNVCWDQIIIFVDIMSTKLKTSSLEWVYDARKMFKDLINASINPPRTTAATEHRPHICMRRSHKNLTECILISIQWNPLQKKCSWTLRCETVFTRRRFNNNTSQHGVSCYSSPWCRGVQMCCRA